MSNMLRSHVRVSFIKLKIQLYAAHVFNFSIHKLFRRFRNEADTYFPCSAKPF